MPWGAYMQGGFSEEVDSLGAMLSVEIDCPVHYPAFNKNLFECKHGVVLPYYVVAAKDWDKIRKVHNLEKDMIRIPI